MIRYLIFPDMASADARSRAAWTPGDGDTVTVRLWDVRVRATDGRAALVIPEGADAALGTTELAALVDALPGDWFHEEE